MSAVRFWTVARKTGLVTATVAVLVWGVGLWLLWPVVGVRGVVGLFVVFWGENLNHKVRLDSALRERPAAPSEQRP